ncbi:MAG: thioredoxin family protein [Sphingobacteriales bacterium]|nr:thioredoxin family protein [Sphingobacteriales bacterium]
MNKLLSVILCCLMLQFSSFAQSSFNAGNGIRFENTSLEEIVAKAEAEGKAIFIETYASWCRSCKWMEHNSFGNNAVIDFYNDNFISLRLDVDREGKAFADRFGVRMVPTLFYFDSKQNLLIKEEGAQEVQDLLKLGKKAVKKAN